jgi:hypothetical protein
MHGSKDNRGGLISRPNHNMTLHPQPSIIYDTSHTCDVMHDLYITTKFNLRHPK